MVTGSAGLMGAETVRFFSNKGLQVIGVDNDLRAYFFGAEASTNWNNKRLEDEISSYQHEHIDIRNFEKLEAVFKQYGKAIDLVLHTAAQPSHDWVAKEPLTDFTINANGTLNLLELTRIHCPEAVFIFTSTNKVYGDTPNQLPLVEYENAGISHKNIYFITVVSMKR
jgi:CDP-paratose 2-epimerase